MAKLIAVLLGSAMMAVGAYHWSSKNPAWWRRLIGGLFMGFGLLIVVLGGALAQ